MLSEKEFLYQLGVNLREKREEKGYKTINAFCSKLAEYELNISDSMFGKYELGHIKYRYKDSESLQKHFT